MADAGLQLAQALRDVAVGCREPRASIDDEHDRVGLGDRLLDLARHLREDTLGHARLEPTRVDDDERALIEPPFAVVTVARDAGHVRPRWRRGCA